MKIFNKDLRKGILYIAEIGVNHEGSLNRCKKLIKYAKSAGADVVKFQCFTPNYYISPENEKFKKIKKFYFDQNKFKEIIKFCKKIKISYLFTAVSHDWLDFIKKHSGVLKIASGDLNFNKFLESVSKSNLKVILSTGISDIEEIANAVKIFKKKFKKNLKKRLILMHCVSNYPVKNEDANTMSVKYLKDIFNLQVGYSNHVIGIYACLSSICLGARVIEFHFTDNKKRKFRDHQLSLDKDDVKNLVKIGNLFNKLMGSYSKNILLESRTDKRILSKGLIASKNLKENKKIKFKDITYARPAKYFFANELNKIIGKKVKRKIKSGFLIKRTDLT